MAQYNLPTNANMSDTIPIVNNQLVQPNVINVPTATAPNPQTTPIMPGQTTYASGQVCTCTPIPSFEQSSPITPAQLAAMAYQKIAPNLNTLQGFSGLSGDMTDAEVQAIVKDHFQNLPLATTTSIATGLYKGDYSPMAAQVRVLMEKICTKGALERIQGIWEKYKTATIVGGVLLVGGLVWVGTKLAKKKSK
jgi:hypothetical protein